MEEFSLTELCRLWTLVETISPGWSADLERKLHRMIQSKSERELSEHEIKTIARGG